VNAWRHGRVPRRHAATSARATAGSWRAPRERAQGHCARGSGFPLQCARPAALPQRRWPSGGGSGQGGYLPPPDATSAIGVSSSTTPASVCACTAT